MGMYGLMFDLLQLVGFEESIKSLILWSIYSYVFFADLFLHKLKSKVSYLSFLMVVGIALLIYAVLHMWIFGIVLSHILFGIGLASVSLSAKWHFLMNSRHNS